MKYISNLYQKLTRFKKVLFIDENTQNYLNFNKKLFEKSGFNKKNNNGIILVDFFDWKPFIFFWSILSNYLARKNNLRIKFFYFPLYSRLGQNFFLFKNDLVKIYKSFNTEKGFTNLGKKLSDDKIKKLEKCFNLFKNEKDLINYRYKKILIGDLIYDSTLRSFQIPTTNLKDIRLKEKFLEAHLIFDLIIDYLKNNNVKYLIPSHCNYNQYGIITRICNQKGIKILILNNLGRGLVNFKLTKYDKKIRSNRNPYYDYKKIFKKITYGNSRLKKKYINIGKKILENRLKGKTSSGIEYLSKSPFEKKLKKTKIKYFKKKSFKVLLALHNFYDAPHKYRSLNYKDYLEWSIKTINFLKKEKINTYIKFHPLKIEEDTDRTAKDIIKNIVKGCKNIIILEENISHFNLLKNKLDIALTCHGTIANELSYFGVKVINCGDNPHINYSFCKNPRTQKEYMEMLKNLKKIKFKISKHELYEFYFMNYYFFEQKKYINKIESKYFVKKSKKNNNDNNIKFHDSSNYYKYIIECEKKIKTVKIIENYIQEYLDKNDGNL